MLQDGRKTAAMEKKKHANRKRKHPEAFNEENDELYRE